MAPRASDEEVIQAARAAYAHEFINRAAEGYAPTWASAACGCRAASASASASPAPC